MIAHIVLVPRIDSVGQVANIVNELSKTNNEAVGGTEAEETWQSYL